MKKTLGGIALLVLAAVLFLGGVLGGGIANIYMLVVAIIDAINAIKSPDPIEFGDVFWAVLFFCLRGIVAGFIMLVGWAGAFFTGSIGLALLND